MEVKSNRKVSTCSTISQGLAVFSSYPLPRQPHPDNQSNPLQHPVCHLWRQGYRVAHTTTDGIISYLEVIFLTVEIGGFNLYKDLI